MLGFSCEQQRNHVTAIPKSEGILP